MNGFLQIEMRKIFLPPNRNARKLVENHVEAMEIP